MDGWWKWVLVTCLMVLLVGGGVVIVVQKTWSLSDKIAAIASIVGLLQVVALVVTIGVMISSSRRQLRAYIHVESTLAKRNGPKWTIEYRLKNAGQTPATNITLTEIAKVVPWPMAELPKSVDTNYLGTMSPLGDFIDCGSEDEITVAPEDLLSKRRAIVLVGKATYRDAFGKRRTTNFCFYVTGDYPPDGGKMLIYERYNEST